MVKKCAGLPLAIVILGGILVTKPSLRQWEKVYNDSLSSLKKGKGLGEDQQNELLYILVRSYKELPPQLKSCFLYLGKFGEDEWIEAENLYQLLIAERIILSSDKRKGETMMQVAESYMGELGSHFANFRFLRVLGLDGVFFDCQTVSGNRFGTSIGSVIGSLIYLRYLSARKSNLVTFPWIQKLVLLQTLKIDGKYENQRAPKSINMLGKLTYLRHLYFPKWNYYYMSENQQKLRFNGLSKLEILVNFDTQVCEVKDLSRLTNLQTLTLTLIVRESLAVLDEMMMYLAKLAMSTTSGLQYLALDIVSHDRLLRRPDIIRQLFWNDTFKFQELSINGKLPELGEIIEHINASLSLIGITSLKLSYSSLEKDPMPVLGKIPTLRDLDLGHAYDGKEMVCSATNFPKLTRLNLRWLKNLKNWRVEQGSMPILSELFICECPKLEELPEGLVYLNSLQKLSLFSMSSDIHAGVSMVDGKEGPEFYKIAHVPNIHIF